MRRALLTILLMTLLPLLTVAGVGAFPTSPSITPAVPSMTYDQSVATFLKLDAMWDAIPAAQKVPVITDSTSAWTWVNEIAPYFVTEGIVDPEPTQGDTVVLPSEISFAWYPSDPDLALHTIANVGICGRAMEINERLITPGDPWMAEDLGLVTLAHEMAHIQGVCGGNTPINDESSAQLISWEILAAMSNSGCQPCYASLIGDLRHRDLGAVEALATKEGKVKEYQDMIKRHLTRDEQAQVARSDRLWVGDSDELAQLLHDYYIVPVSAWVLALGQGRDTIDGVQLPINPFNDYTPQYTQRPLLIDDLAYLWKNADSSNSTGSCESGAASVLTDKMGLNPHSTRLLVIGSPFLSVG